MGKGKSNGISRGGLDSYYYGMVDWRPYRPTTREARRALLPEEEAIIQAGAERVREAIALGEEWEDTAEQLNFVARIAD